jgi:L,D-transpeptidase ErfK/SrfK
MNKPLLCLCCLLGGLPLGATAEEFILPPDDVGLVGVLRYESADAADTLLDIARRHGLGQGHIANANPGVDMWIPGGGTKVLLPTRHVLPNAPREGIILNVPEMRLFYYPPPTKGSPPKVIIHPISVGRYDWRTPIGLTKVTAKDKNPTWRPTDSLKAEALADGRVLPDEVPPGPENPLGGYALRLGVPGYLIHGTDKPWGLGMRVTHGCIRMYPENIETLFNQVTVSTPVNFVNQPAKLGWLGDILFVEVHPPLEEDLEKQPDQVRVILDQVSKEREKRAFTLDGAAVKRAVQEHKGIPVPISK